MVDVYENSYKAVLQVPGKDTGVISVSAGGEDIVFPVIFTNFNANFSEKIQVVSAFGEHIHIYAFGKNAGNASISGIIGNQDAEFVFPGFKANYLDLYERVRAYSAASSGTLLKISGPGNCAMKAIAQGTNFGLTGDSYSTINFSLNLIIVSFIGSPPATMLGV